MPVRPTELGELFALLLIVSVPPREPRAVGLNVTVTEHLDLDAIVAPHPFTIAKSPLPAMLENVTGVVLLLFAIVTFFGLADGAISKRDFAELESARRDLQRDRYGVVVGVAVGVVVAVAVAVGVAVAVALATGVRTAEGLGSRRRGRSAVKVAVAVAW